MKTDADIWLERFAACHPGLEQRLDAVRAEWVPEVPPPVVAMGALGTTLVSLLPDMSTTDIRCVSVAVEDALQLGTNPIGAAVATGFLEAILARAASAPGIERLVVELGPHARRYCQEWDRFTGCRTPGLW